MKAKEFLNKIMRGDKATIKDNVGIIAFNEKENEVRGFKTEPSPVFSINSSNKMVITCTDNTATIYYKKSTESSWTAYSNPINTPASACTYQAYAKSNDDDYKDSAIVSYEWTKIATPTISISDSDLKITITCATNDVTIKYRKGTSGSFSTYSSSDKPTAEAGQTYQAKAEKLGMITSDTASETAPVSGPTHIDITQGKTEYGAGGNHYTVNIIADAPYNSGLINIQRYDSYEDAWVEFSDMGTDSSESILITESNLELYFDNPYDPISQSYIDHYITVWVNGMGYDDGREYRIKAMCEGYTEWSDATDVYLNEY